MDTTTWRIEIEVALKRNEETWADVVGSTLTADEMSVQFNTGYGNSEGAPFTLWTHNRVYFPAVYNGDEWVESVPRHPCDEETVHVGGE